MAIKNDIEIYINGISYTGNLAIPIKTGNMLDEALDEASVSLRYTKVQQFPRLATVEIITHNKLYWHNEDEAGDTQDEIQYYLVGDDNAEEQPIGSGYYSHEILLIEPTKATERDIVSSLTFTNSLGRDFTKVARWVVPEKSN